MKSWHSLSFTIEEVAMKKCSSVHLIVFTALILAFTLSISGVQVAQAAPINLSLWIFSPSLSPTEQAVLTSYQTSHPEISFTIYQPADFAAELAVAIPAGAGPDILYYPNDAMHFFILNHYLTPLESYGVTSTYLNTTFELPAANAAQYGGAVYALPHFMEGVALVYNKDTAILPSQYLPTQPLNFNDLQTKAALYQTAFPGKTLFCNQGFNTLDAYHVAPIFFGYGVPDYIDSNGRVYINDPRAVSAAGWIQDIHASLADAQDYTTCQNQFIAGNVGMWWTGPWAIAGLISGGMDSADFGILPMGKPYVGVKQQMITVNAVSRGYADEAVDFLLYFNNAANSIQYAVQENQIPANTAALNSPAVQALPIVQGFRQSIALGTPLGKSVFTPCQWDPVANAVITLWNNPSANPQTEMDIAQDQAQACVNALRDTYFPERLMLPLVRR